jgi:prepilin-type N-terminal cleavage/methylation domain-containing protein
MTNKKSQAGFTIIELSIATAVFSLILLVVVSGIVTFTRQYIKSVHRSQTEETVRLVNGEISNALRLSSASEFKFTKDANSGAYCTGTVQYTAYIGNQVGDADKHALIRSPYRGGDCVPKTFGANDTELLGKGMFLKTFDITATDSSFTVTMRVLNGDKVLFSGDKCKLEAGSEYCAAASASTTVQGRL